MIRIYVRTTALLFLYIITTITAGRAQTIITVLEATRICSNFPGATASAQIAACIDDLPSTGGVADATGIEGAQPWNSDPFTGETKQITLTLGATSYTVSANTTVPTNVTLRFRHGAVLSVNSGVTVILNGQIDAPPYMQIFSGAGTVTTNSTSARQRVVYPTWWGAVGDASTASGGAFVSAVTFAGTSGIISVPAGIYNVSWVGQTGDCLNLHQGQTLTGRGAALSNTASRQQAACFRVVDATDVTVEGIEYDGNISVSTPDANNGVSALMAIRADRLTIRGVYFHDVGLDSLYIEDSQDVIVSDFRSDHAPRFDITFSSTLENADNFQINNATFTNSGYGDSASGGCIDIESAGFLTRYVNITNFTCRPHANVFSAGIVLHDNGHNLSNVTVIMPTNVAKPALTLAPDASNIRVGNSYFASSGDLIPTLELEGDDIQFSNTNIVNTGDGTPNQTCAVQGVAGTGATDVSFSNVKFVGHHGSIVRNLNTSAIWTFVNCWFIAGSTTTVEIQLNGPLNAVTGGYFERARLNVNGKGHRVTGAAFDGLSSTNNGIDVSATASAYMIANNIFTRYGNGIEVNNGATRGFIGGNLSYNNETNGIRLGSSGIALSVLAPNVLFDDQGTPTQDRGFNVSGGGWVVMTQVLSGNTVAQGINEVNVFTNGDTTPSVGLGFPVYATNNSGGTAITTFDDGWAGQMFTLIIGDGNTDFTDSATLTLNGGANWTTAKSGDSITFVKNNAGAWVEVSRSVN